MPKRRPERREFPGGGSVTEVWPDDFDIDAADTDDDPDTDHLARLADPDVLARVEQIERDEQ